ncbi:importin subunit beta-3 [Balamuthia mandrillaris]
MALFLAQQAIHEFNSQVAEAWAKGRLENGSPEMEGMLSAVAWLIKNMQRHWKGLAAKERDALRDGVCQALELATCMSVLRTEEQAKEEEELLPAPQKGTERKVQAKVWNELNTFTLDDALKKATDETEREIWQFAIAVCFLDYLCEIKCQNSKLHRLLLGENPANLFATKSPRMLLQLQAQADRMFSMMVLAWYDQTYAKCLLLNNDLRQAIAARVKGMLLTQQDDDYIRSCGAQLRKWAAPEVRQLRGLEVGVQLSRYYELDNEQLSQTVHDILALCIEFTRDFVLTKDSILVEHFLVLLRAWDKLENMDHMGDAIGKLIQCIFLCSTHHSVPKGIRCVALDLLINWYKKYPSIFHKSYNNTALQTLKSFAGPHDPDISIDEALTKQAFKARTRYLRKPLVLVEGVMFSVLMMDEDLSDYNAATEFLGHLTSDVPPANDLIFALLPTLLSSQRWQMRWTAWIIVGGAASNLDHSQFKAIISQMREESVNDTEPRVRWVMCAALGQLCAKLPYFVKDDWSQKAAILAHDLIVHDTSAKVRSHACSIVALFCQSPDVLTINAFLTDSLLKLLRKELSKSSNDFPELKRRAAQALDSLGNKLLFPKKDRILPLFYRLAEYAQQTKDDRLAVIVAQKLADRGVSNYDKDGAKAIQLLLGVDDHYSKSVTKEKHVALPRMCTALGPRFAPFMSTTISQYLALLKDTSFSAPFHRVICKALCVIAENQKECFRPYLQSIVEALLELFINATQRQLQHEIFLTLPVYLAVDDNPESVSMIVKRFVQAATKAINVTRDYGLVSTVAIGLRLVIPKQRFDDLFARPCFELCQAILTYIGKEWDKVRKTARTAQEQKQQISDEVAPLVSQLVELCKHCKDCSEGFFAFLDDLHSPYPLFLQLIVAQVDVTPVAHWSLHVKPFFAHVIAQPRPTIPTLRALAARECLRQAQQTPTTASSPRLPEDLREYLETHHRCGLCRRPYLEAVLVGRGAAPSTAKWKQHALCRPFWALCSFDCLAEARSWSSTTSKIIGLDTEKTCEVLLHALLSE